MKRLQAKIRTLRAKLQELRMDLFFQSLPEKERKIFYDALRKLNDFEDVLIINHIMKK